jgi:hypothetical protein
MPLKLFVMISRLFDFYSMLIFLAAADPIFSMNIPGFAVIWIRATYFTIEYFLYTLAHNLLSSSL